MERFLLLFCSIFIYSSIIAPLSINSSISTLSTYSMPDKTFYPYAVCPKDVVRGYSYTEYFVIHLYPLTEILWFRVELDEEYYGGVAGSYEDFINEDWDSFITLVLGVCR